MTDSSSAPQHRAAIQDRAAAGAKGLAKVATGFKDFISRGNVVELAVAVVIGGAFTKLIGAVVDGFISPLIAAIFGKTDLSNVLTFTINGAKFSLGLIVNALIVFLITAAVVYFLIVLPMNALASRRKKGVEDEPEAPAEDILLLQEIRDLLANRATPAVTNDTTTGGTTPPIYPPTAG